MYVKALRGPIMSHCHHNSSTTRQRRAGRREVVECRYEKKPLTEQRQPVAVVEQPTRASKHRYSAGIKRRTSMRNRESKQATALLINSRFLLRWEWRADQEVWEVWKV
ncbi:hypothetical protein Aduo_002077 [Ancylostoma duodenale]